jgi:hypothetical protein
MSPERDGLGKKYRITEESKDVVIFVHYCDTREEANLYLKSHQEDAKKRGVKLEVCRPEGLII